MNRIFLSIILSVACTFGMMAQSINQGGSSNRSIKTDTPLNGLQNTNRGNRGGKLIDKQQEEEVVTPPVQNTPPQTTPPRQNQNRKKTTGTGDPSRTDGTLGGYAYVDLGLPSGTLWASYNVGANSPSEYGSYFAWGEVTPKSEYRDEDCMIAGKGKQWLKANGYANYYGDLIKSYDAANANWGTVWRLPTAADVDELLRNTQAQWTTYEGVKGIKVTSNINGHCIFLPAAGYRENDVLYSRGDYGHYWTSSLDDNDESRAAYLLFGDDSYQRYSYNDGSGRPVRPVAKQTPYFVSRHDGVEQGHYYVDLGLPSGTKWATCNVGACAPEEFGDYYARYETSVKNTYGNDNCPALDKDVAWLRSNGYLSRSGDVGPSHDAATQCWGSNWRMPTANEVDELVENTRYEWMNYNGVNGILVTSKINGKSIFFPAAGHIDDDHMDSAGEYGHYWSSSPYEEDGTKGCYLLFGEDRYYRYQYSDGAGRTIRAVTR